MILLTIVAQAAAEPESAVARARSFYERAAGPCASGTVGEVVVCGRKDQERYRIPVELRSSGDVKPQQQIIAADGGLRQLCSDTGNSPCGTGAIPVLTVRDGKTYIGPPR